MKNRKNKTLQQLSLLVLILLVWTGCKTPVEPDDVVLPSNLVTAITVTEGLVDIDATADNTNFYTFTFYEGDDSTTIESNDGSESYTYTTNGTHAIRTRAHVSYTDYIEVNETVTISLDPGFTGGIPTTGYTTPMTYAGYTLIWNDEFDGTSLSSDWVFETGTGNWGWGNNELQYYREENLQVTDGMMIITAKEENYNGSNYTSSRIKTQGRRSFMHGRIDIRAALPYGQGMWPALWMLGDNITTDGWPACGEIDIMEMVGGSGSKDNTVHGTIHWDNNGSHASYGNGRTLSSGILAEEWHVFSIVWDQNSIRWLMDDVEYNVADLTPAGLSEFQQNFFFVFNVAVGGNWPGSPNASTVFPQTMAVDYVRVFQ